MIFMRVPLILLIKKVMKKQLSMVLNTTIQVLFRDTFVGKFSPISGGFITDKSSIYLYTGVQAQYGIGPVKILPSFAPGYYNAGNGKDLGSALEFKSEIKLAYDVLENSQIGFSYSHISNNDWGEDGKNPG